MSIYRTYILCAALAAAPLAFAAETLPAPPSDQATSGETPPSPPAEAPKEDKVVCKKIKTTGSRLPTEKICKKQSEWDAEAAANAEETKREMDRQTNKQ